MKARGSVLLFPDCSLREQGILSPRMRGSVFGNWECADGGT
jgi:hypothetical protein